MKSMEQMQREFEDSENKMSGKFKKMGKKGQKKSLMQKKVDKLFDRGGKNGTI